MVPFAIISEYFLTSLFTILLINIWLRMHHHSTHLKRRNWLSKYTTFLGGEHDGLWARKFFVKFSVFKPTSHKNYSAEIPLHSQSCCAFLIFRTDFFFCSWIKNRIIHASEANIIVNKDPPSRDDIRHHLLLLTLNDTSLDELFTILVM